MSKFWKVFWIVVGCAFAVPFLAGVIIFVGIMVSAGVHTLSH